MKSTHVCEVIPINLEKHEGADSLSIIQVFGGGYSCVLRTEDWKDKKKAVYICPDSLVDTTRPEFSFLADEKKLYEVDGKKVYARIKARKIRGVVSFGLCVPVEGAELGEDWADRLGVIHFDEEIHSVKQKGVNMTGGEVESPPDCYYIKYDVDSLRRYKEVFEEGELVYVSEKQHGSCSKFVYNNGKIYCGSRNEWKREYSSPPNYENIEKQIRETNSHRIENILNEEQIKERLYEISQKIINWNPSQNCWWKAYRQYPGIEKFCRDKLDYVLYGELLGSTDLKYGIKPGEVGFSAFDILRPDGNFMDVEDFLNMCATYDIPKVPIIERSFPFNFEKICEMAEGKSLMPGADHLREGVVIKSLQEKVIPGIGRKCFKIVGAGYLERA